jgi:hypothetical protein
MTRRFVLLAALVLAASACASPRTDQSAKLAPLVGVNEAQLVAGMGRTPDLTEQPAPGISLLQWRWQRSFTVPYNVLPYQYGGGSVQPLALTGTGIAHEQCFVEWTVEQGTARRYRLVGDACPAAAAETTKT